MSEKAKHTPGPWEVSRHTPTRVDTPYGSIGVNWSCTTDGGATQQKAEEAARLIASAPDLLAALEKAQRSLLRTIEGDLEAPVGCAAIYGRSGNPKPCSCGFCERVVAEAEIRSVAAKARGEG